MPVSTPDARSVDAESQDNRRMPCRSTRLTVLSCHPCRPLRKHSAKPSEIHRRSHSLNQHSYMKGGGMRNSYRMRQPIGKCVDGCIDGGVKRLSNEMVARRWLNADVSVGVLPFQLLP